MTTADDWSRAMEQMVLGFSEAMLDISIEIRTTAAVMRDNRLTSAETAAKWQAIADCERTEVEERHAHRS